MSDFVLDCSVTVAWLFQNQASAATDELLIAMREKGAKALVPGIWHLEVGNVLTQAERRDRITNAQVSTALELIRMLPIVTDSETEDRSFREILSLARTASLTTYDAAYLELALRRGMPLATLDLGLIRAAKMVTVETLPG